MDMQKIPPIHQKRIITFFNHFLITTVSFLNKFIYTCENALIKLDRKMETLEATICMLETQLNSVPNLMSDTLIANQNEELSTEILSSQEEDEINKTCMNEDSEINTPEQIPPELAKYNKMIQFGVPIRAVKLKMKQDGLDPNLLNIND